MGVEKIMLHAREITLGAIVLRIIMAEVLGGVIGSERGRMNRPAGMRTYMLVSIGSCVVMLINQYAYQVYGVGDPVRLGAQVVSGIGFLGAGTIIVTTHNQIKGLTTAAGLWASACIGLAIGIGLYEVAIVACIAVFSVLTVLHQWDFYMSMAKQDNYKKERTETALSFHFSDFGMRGYISMVKPSGLFLRFSFSF